MLLIDRVQRGERGKHKTGEIKILPGNQMSLLIIPESY